VYENNRKINKQEWYTSIAQQIKAWPRNENKPLI
jgi:hypothetical protein